jgi:hypothetical protein
MLQTRIALSLLVPFLLTACSSTPKPTGSEPSTPPQASRPTIRIDAGASAPYTDSAGNVWLADTGFADGETVDRGEIPIAGTSDPGLYRTERYGMTAFSHPVANGKYKVKLHFAETYDGVTAAGERVFSLNVEKKEIKDLDLWTKAPGFGRAYIETIDVEVTDAKLDITFTPKEQNTEINAVEIVPAP